MEPTPPNTCWVCGSSFDSVDELRSHDAEHNAEMGQIVFQLHIHLDVCQKLLEDSKPIEAQEWLGKARDDVRSMAPFIGWNLLPDATAGDSP